MKKVEAIIRPERLDKVAAALKAVGLEGFTITDVRGHGTSPERKGEWRGQTYEVSVTHKMLIEIIVEDGEVQTVVEAITRGAHTGHRGDGLITVMELAAVYQIRLATPTGAVPQAEAQP
jgi:nitrogen regulatory protein PII